MGEALKLIIKLNDDINLQNVLYVPQFRFNLLSVDKLVSNLKCNVTFDSNGCYIQDSMRKHWLLGRPRSGLYILEEKSVAHEVKFNVLTASVSSTMLSKAKL